MVLSLGVLCALFSIPLLYGLIQDEKLPRELHECYLNGTRGRDITTTPSYTVHIHCLNYYWTKTYRDRYHRDPDPSMLNWIQTLDRNLHLRRQKRQVQPLRRRREIRTLSDQERRAFFSAVLALKQDTTIRPNMYDVIANLHNAAAIQSAHFGPNFLGWHRYYLYIFEEALRTKDPLVTLPYWDSTFDFNMNVDDPVDSVMWSDIFVGNGNGLVTSGPFANWRTTNNAFLDRNIGSPGSLMTPEGIVAVLSQTFHRDIVQPTAIGINDLEGLHNNVHAWIGGHMNGLSSSAYDPVFFLHHCFVDYIWEQFRFQQFSRGINPENDYPNNGVEGHWPWSIMVNLGRIRNVDGYHNAFTQFVYEYESSPRCPDCGNSLYLECDSTRQVCVSMASRAFQNRRSFNGFNIRSPISSLLRNGRGMAFRSGQREISSSPIEKFVPTLIDPRTQKTPNRLKRAVYNPNLSVMKSNMHFSQGKNNVLFTSNANSNPFSSISIDTPYGQIQSSISNLGSPGSSIGFQPNTGGGYEPTFLSSTQGRQTGNHNHGQVLATGRVQPVQPQPGLTQTGGTNSNFMSNNILNSQSRNLDISDDDRTERDQFIDVAIQNSFALDGVADVSRWAFMPIRIIYRRPPGSSFNCKMIKDGQVVEGYDFYSPVHYHNLLRQVNTGNPAPFAKPVRSGSGASKVFVQSDGLSYDGKYIDYAIIDERQPISETVTYVAFKNPKLGESKMYISAYDANGRVCQPRCLVNGSNPPLYKECSGVLTVNDTFPRMYEDTYGDAVMSRYSFTNLCPTNKDVGIYLTFYCDYQNQWPWINYPHY